MDQLSSHRSCRSCSAKSFKSQYPRILMGAMFLAVFALTSALAQVQWKKSSFNPLLPSRALEPSVFYDSAEGHITKFWVSNSYDILSGFAVSDTELYLSGTPVLARGKPGEFDALAISSCEVVKKDSVYFMYYTATGQSDSSYIGLATSADGVLWTKYEGNPVLRPGPPGSWDAQMVLYPRVLIEDGVFKMWYHMSPDGWYTNVGAASSTDGYTWTKYEDNPVVLHGYYSIYDYDGRGAGIAGVTKVDSMYYMLSIAVDMSYTISLGLVTSKDGYHWHKYGENPVIRLGEPGSWDSEFLGGGSLRFYGDRFRLWYSGYWYPPYQDGTWNIGYSTAPLVTLSVPASTSIQPAKPMLSQNYPNPFNPSTTIEFDVPSRQHVRIVVYTILGQEIAVVTDDTMEAGKHSVRWSPNGLASGPYYYQLTIGGNTQTKKMMFLK